MTSDEKFCALVAHPYAAEIAGRLFEVGHKAPARNRYGDMLICLSLDLSDEIARARARGKA